MGRRVVLKLGSLAQHWTCTLIHQANRGQSHMPAHKMVVDGYVSLWNIHLKRPEWMDS